jgi:hypothetical protein
MKLLFLIVSLQVAVSAQKAIPSKLDLSKLNQPHLESRFGAPIEEWFVSRSGDLLIARYGKDKLLCEGEVKPGQSSKPEEQSANLELLLISVFSGYDTELNYKVPANSLAKVENISGEQSCLNYEIERVGEFVISHHNYGCIDNPKVSTKASVARASDACRLDLNAPQNRAREFLPVDANPSVSGNQFIDSGVLRNHFGHPVEETFAIDKVAQLAVTYSADGQACEAQLSVQEPLLRSFVADDVYLDSQKAQVLLKDLVSNYEQDPKGCFEAVYGAPSSRMCTFGKTWYEQQFQGKDLVRVLFGRGHDQSDCKGIPEFE